MKKQPFSGIRLIVSLLLLFVVIVTAGMFVLMYLYNNSQKTDVEQLGNMQAATLTITGISMALIISVLTIISIYKEKQKEIENEKIENDQSNADKERYFLARLVYIQTNKSRYMLGLQLNYLIEVGNEILNSDIHCKSQLLYITCSLLESQIVNCNEFRTSPKEIYDKIIFFSKSIIEDGTIEKSKKIDAIFMFVNANYRIFRDALERNPDITNIENLNLSIQCLEQNKISEFSTDEKITSAQLNLYGLIYYWKFNYSFANKDHEDIEQLIKKSVDFFENAVRNNNRNEQIYNNYGCSLIGFGKYYASKNNEIASNYYDKAIVQFNSAKIILDSYEKPYINLIDICCLKIRLTLKLTGTVYLLRPLIHSNENFDQMVKEQIEIGKGYYKKAEQSGKLLYNVYYKIAELETYKLLLALRQNSADSEDIKRTIMHYLSKSEEDKKTVKSLKKKRQVLELCGDIKEMEKVNTEIMILDYNNSEEWNKLIGRSQKSNP